MSKAEKLLVGFIIMAIAILAYANIAKAASYSVGQTVSINYTDYLNDDDLFCVEHKQSLNSKKVTYKVISQVDIRGNTSTDHTGKSIESWHNAKLAHILSADNGGNGKQNSPVQNAIWNYMYTWMNNVGQYHAGLYVGFVSNVQGSSSYLDSTSSDYANELANVEFTDNTNKQAIRVQSDGENLRIGPFNWSFSGTLKSVVVKDQDGNAISGVTFVTYTGTTANTIGIGDIQSGKDFYISIPISSGITGITTITASGSITVEGVRIWFLESQSGYNYQNLIARDRYDAPYDYETDFEYDIDLLGSLKVIKVDQDDHEIKLQGVGFKIQNKQTGLYVHQDTNGAITYVDESQATEFLTDENGEILIENLIVGTYVAYETQNPNYGYEIVSDGVEHTVVVDKTEDFVIENKLLLGNLKVIKVNEDNHEIKLQGVGFKIQNKETGLYVHQAADGTITYVEESEATEFVTDENGEILIENLIVGTYIAYETQNPNYGYEIISDGVEHTVIVDKTEEFVIENKQIYVKLSGYVWLDKQSGKQSERNSLYRDDVNDDTDELLEGVIVRLIDRTTGEVVKNDNGEDFYAVTKEIDLGDNIIRYYQFVDVRVEDLENYYIEFEYDGLTYTNVTPHIDMDNGSKAAENPEVRDTFNKGFSTIEGASQTTGVALDENGNVAHELTYNKDAEQHTSTLINEGLPVGQYPITANTDETGYSIIDQFEAGMEEIPYINLGLYERIQPDLALIKDMQNVRLAINGYQHIYEYAQRFANLEAQEADGDYSDTAFNVGVKFASEYVDDSYTRAIYKADYEYVNEEDSSRELKVYVTYRIGVMNEASGLTTQVNNLVDYFDSRYTIVAAGTGIDQEGIITGNIEYDQETYNDEYSKAIIYTNSRIEYGQTNEFYVQFELSREAVLEILNDRETLDNVVEINSYSTFDGNGSVYAGVDLDSNPGNAIPGDMTTYEDDTDSSPSLKLEVADAREIAGKVFLDSTSGELLTGQIRQGSGQYEEGETGIPGVEVKLTENTGTGLVYTATTDDNGDFYISDFIPGDYTITYTWGDETYTVQNYKGTVYDKARYDANMANKEWYKTDVETRWTDAVDDYDTRLAIDAELSEITNATEITINKMDSTTPTLGIGVEYESTYTASYGDRYVYRIENVDFGIVERARQDISLNKRVSTMKLTLANGQPLVDLQITEDGKLEGQTGNVTYLPPSPGSIPANGMVRLELDSEIIQGSRLQIGYEIKATNNSEIEYLSENYYKYGIIEGDVVTITPSAIIDYLDSDWDFDAESNPDWEAIQKDDSRISLAEEVRNSTSIDSAKIFYTEALAGYDLQPTESATVMLNVSKLLTSSEDIELGNETEIVKVEKPGGPNITSIPGNYVPGTGPSVESDDGMAEIVIVTPNTGENMNYILPIAITVIACVILGVGVVLIKKKVLKK